MDTTEANGVTATDVVATETNEIESSTPPPSDQQQTTGAGGDNGGGVVTGAGGDSGDATVGIGKGNEDKKIFVGGIGYDTTNEDLLAHFATFGEVSQAQVKYDRMTGRSRGFAFVEFAGVDGCRKALASRSQTIKGKPTEIKPAKSRENKKVFVGGLPSDYSEQELKDHFEQYGKVEDIEWPFDKQRNAKRNFAFIVFEEEDGADKASGIPKQSFGDRECDVKKAVPQGRRGPTGMIGGPRGGGRGAGGRMGGWGMGGAQGGIGGWGNYAATGAGGWGDWYGTAAATGYGSYGGGYSDDYSSSAYNDYWGVGGGGGGGSQWNQYNAYDAYGAGGGGQQSGGRRGGGTGYQQQYQ